MLVFELYNCVKGWFSAYTFIWSPDFLFVVRAASVESLLLENNYECVNMYSWLCTLTHLARSIAIVTCVSSEFTI